MGVSMGGGGALTFSMRHPEKVAAVCDIMGVTDFARFYNDGNYQASLGGAFGGSPAEKPDAYRERSALYHTDVLKRLPILILHGDIDYVVPVMYSEMLYAGLKAEGGRAEFVRVPGCGHDDGVIRGLEDKVLDWFS